MALPFTLLYAGSLGSLREVMIQAKATNQVVRVLSSKSLGLGMIQTSGRMHGKEWSSPKKVIWDVGEEESQKAIENHLDASGSLRRSVP